MKVTRDENVEFMCGLCGVTRSDRIRWDQRESKSCHHIKEITHGERRAENFVGKKVSK